MVSEAFRTGLDSSAKNISFCMALGTSSVSENSSRRKWDSLTDRRTELRWLQTEQDRKSRRHGTYPLGAAAAEVGAPLDSSLIFAGHWIGSMSGAACEATQNRRRTDQGQQSVESQPNGPDSNALLPLHDRMYRPFERP